MSEVALFEYDEKRIGLLRKSFPSESIQVKKNEKNSKTGKRFVLVGIKPQYIIERLNDVFSHAGWDYQVVEKGIEGKQVWVLGRLTIYAPVITPNRLEGPISRNVVTIKEQFGTSDYKGSMPLGDALKSAATNAMEKCASLLDIAHEAYKGLLTPPSGTKGDDDAKEVERDNLLSELTSTCKKYEIDKDSFKTLKKTVHGKEDGEIDDFSTDEIEAMIDHLNEHKSPFLPA